MINIKKRVWSVLLILMMMGVGGVFVVQAQTIPDLFWRVVQKGQDLFFQYGDLTAPKDKVIVTPSGQVGIDTTQGGHPTPSPSSLLELKGTDKAVLVTRLSRASQVETPQKGMIIYVKDQDCFKWYQGNAWSACFGAIESVTSANTRISSDGSRGSLYYNVDNNTFQVHDGQAWSPLDSSLVVIGTQIPSQGEDGDSFYHTVEGVLYVYQASTDQWIPITGGLQSLSLGHDDCQQVDYEAAQGKSIKCPEDMFATRLFYENATWSDTVDNLATPEISALECCAIAYREGAPVFPQITQWQVGAPFGTCTAQGQQTQTVQCKVLGTQSTVEDSQCSHLQRPATTRSVHHPKVKKITIGIPARLLKLVILKVKDGGRLSVEKRGVSK